jgi:signal transduction histidine kinase
MTRTLRVLIVEDSEPDTELILRELNLYGYLPEHRRVDNGPDMARALESGQWDIVISDHTMPAFSSIKALELLRNNDPDIPIIIVSGQIGEDTAVAIMKAGANDYIMKNHLKLLGAAIERELTEAENRRRRRKAEAELQAKKAELKVAKKMDAIKDEFIGMVSHELKTPLTVIIGALKVAETPGVSPEERQQLVHDAAASAESLAAMVENLLELSRYQSNRLKITSKTTSIADVAGGVLRQLEPRSAKHKFHLDIPPDCPPVTSDPFKVERVLYNLMENSIKYSPDGGDVRVFAKRLGKYVVIGVSDQGMGIPAAAQAKLFRSFERVYDRQTTNIAGVGLGLKVCRILVELQGGKIWVESEPGKGSTFYFSLPIAQSGKD